MGTLLLLFGIMLLLFDAIMVLFGTILNELRATLLASTATLNCW